MRIELKKVLLPVAMVGRIIWGILRNLRGDWRDPNLDVLVRHSKIVRNQKCGESDAYSREPQVLNIIKLVDDAPPSSATISALGRITWLCLSLI